MATARKLAVLAIGGNSLIKDKDHERVSDQFAVTRETCRHITHMLEQGWNVVVTHGNGPQVGFILRRCELSLAELHPVPLDSIGADTQGSIGYMIQQSLTNEFARAGLDYRPVTVVTQVLVDRDDPAFQNPSKPIGSFMDEATAHRHAEQEGWQVREDAGRGWRRVVASPKPLTIVERREIKKLIDMDFIVICGGGGGIPVIRQNRKFRGVEAVIDKDLASSVLAREIEAAAFVIASDVPGAGVNWGGRNQQILGKVSLSEMDQHVKAGQFPAGSMGPKVEAIMDFYKATGKRGIICHLEDIERAIEGNAGTEIIT